MGFIADRDAPGSGRRRPPRLRALRGNVLRPPARHLTPSTFSFPLRIAGIGNWVADEALWLARIHPEAAASTLSEPQVAYLLASLTSVVKKSVAARADDSLYPRNWIFHTRWGKTTGATVDGHRISFIDVGGRTTAFVPGLQKKGERGGGGGSGGGGTAKRVKAEPASPAPPPPPPKRVKVEKAPAPAPKGTVAKPRAKAAKVPAPARTSRSRRV